MISFTIIYYIINYYNKGTPCNQPLKQWLIAYLIKLNLNYFFFIYTLINQHFIHTIQYLTLKKLIKFISLLIYFYGYFYIFNKSSNCAKYQANIYQLSKYLFIYDSIQIFLPIITIFLLSIMIIFCMPLLLIWIRFIDETRSNNINTGLTESIIQTQLPIINYSTLLSSLNNNDNINEQQQQQRIESSCSICLQNYNPNDTLIKLPSCNHYFHANCISNWLLISASCPICRENLSYLANNVV